MPQVDIPSELTERLRAARRVCVLTGAGVSAESGLATFREAQSGLWARFRPEDLATPDAFRRDPELVWNWYRWRRKLAQQASPNPAHRALAEMQARVSDFTLVTQNVDGLHQRAGNENVVELHGSLNRARCLREDVVIALGETPEGVMPRCSRCGAMLRPDVVWFGEALPGAALQAAMEAATTCDVFLSVGTSGLVAPASSLAPLAGQGGAVVVVVNPDAAPPVSAGFYHLAVPAGQALPALLRAVWPED